MVKQILNPFVNRKSKAFETVKAPSQAPALFSLSSNLNAAGVQTVSDAVLYLERLLLRVPLKEAARNSMVKFLELRSDADTIDFDHPATEIHLREVVHLIMSTPEYQLA